MRQSETRYINNALISVHCKEQLHLIVDYLHKMGVQLYSTGGTLECIKKLGIKATAVEDITDYPSLFDGRVKTLHPKIFGGILARRHNSDDLRQLAEYHIPLFDLVVVDLYPFEETVKQAKDEQDIIEKIDIGGISLIRAAAKNYADVLVVSARTQYDELLKLLEKKEGKTDLSDRKHFASMAFQVSSQYDTAIFNYYNRTENIPIFQQHINTYKPLRYGENPHQRGWFYGSFEDLFEQLHGKEISYNNMLDLEAALLLIDEFDDTTVAILKHNNACGLATRSNITEAWEYALAGDPVSSFGGVIITNGKLDATTAEAINKIFFELIIAPAYDEEALHILQQKKNRIILVRKTQQPLDHIQFRSLLNGVLVQDKDCKTTHISDLLILTDKEPSTAETEDLLFADKIVKHTKSNAIVIAKNKQLYATGTGQTSRVDALKQAINKAKNFGFNMQGAVMASDAFFPFPDCVEIAGQEGITAVIQPGGSIHDKLSINYCNKHNMAMVATKIRHFKH